MFGAGSDMADEVKEVCEFLRTNLMLEVDIIEKFKKEKICLTAANEASDADLRELGLAKGDIIKLKSFCLKKLQENQSAELVNKKKELLESILEKNKSKRKYHDPPKNKKPSAKTRKVFSASTSKKVQVGWLHYNSDEKCFKNIRQGKGGGIRDLTLPLSATKDDVIQAVKSYFFPGGKSQFGDEEVMHFSLANFQKEEILSDIDVDGETLPFSIEAYSRATKLPRLKLYLYSRPSEQPTDNNYYENESLSTSVEEIIDIDVDSDDDSSLLTPVFGLEETRKLKADQDAAYNESLLIDQEKAKMAKEKHLLESSRKEEQEQKASRQQELQQKRLLRVPDEPQSQEDSVLIQVRHITLGNLKRNFHTRDQISSVYDWVGSMSPLPLDFELSDYKGKVCLPNQSVLDVQRCSLYMTETESSPPLQDDGQVNFRGFGSHEDDNNDTLPQSLYDPFLPQHLLAQEEDDSADSDAEVNLVLSEQSSGYDRGQYFRQVALPLLLSQSQQNRKPKLEQKRLEIQEVMDNDGASKVVELKRWDIVSDLMWLYNSDKETPQTRLLFKLNEESGSDLGGVSREVYSTFWKEGCIKFCEGNESIFVLRQSGITKQDCITLGQIITHGYIMTGFFPIHLSQSYMQAMLLGEETVTDDFVMKDYINYLAPYEGNMLQKILTKSKLEEDEVQFTIDLEDRYGVHSMPNASNIKNIVVQMARSELLEMPMHTMSKLKQGMMSSTYGQQLWKDISIEDLDEIYQAQSPNPGKVLSLLTTDENVECSAEESKAYTFLKRYVRSLDQKKCADFLKYCTGSTTVVVQKISVTFFKSMETEPLPKAHTCGSVLQLPCNRYPTYNAFKTVMDKLLENPLSYQFRFQ